MLICKMTNKGLKIQQHLVYYVFFLSHKLEDYATLALTTTD